MVLIYATPVYDRWWTEPRTSVTTDKTPVDGGFADFFALETVKLVGECTNFERAVASSQAPPNLKLLAAESKYPLGKLRQKLQPLDESTQSALDFVPFFRAPSSSVPKCLKSLELTSEVIKTEHDNLMKDVAKELGEMGAQFLFFVKHETDYFPPFLDGEEEPYEDVYFDGQHIVRNAAELY